LVDVKLYGHLRARFGRTYRLAVKTPGEAVRALCAVVKGFEAYVRQHSEPGYRVLVDKTPIGAEELHHPSGIAAIKFVPVVTGAAGGGKIVAGVALIGLSFLPGLQGIGFSVGALKFTASSIAFNLGVSMALSGVAQMLAGTPKAPTPAERPDNQPSFAFNGAVNVTAQGQAVPLCYGGPIRIGSVVISTGLSTAQLPA
jgi:predicted phage tail protein